MSGFGKLSFAQKKCVSTVGMLMQKTGMAGPGARIGVAVSGGVDSFALIKTLTIRKAILPFPIELMVLHVNPGFNPDSHKPLVEWTKSEGLAAHIELTDHGPRAHSDENRKNSACFFCSMLRRKRLFDLCSQYNLTHLAFGHNADDLVVTFFMNVVQNGRVDGLSASEDFFGGRLKVIRPALFLEKSFMRTAARQWALPIWKNDCPSSGSTRRTEIHDWLQLEIGRDKRIRNNVFNALTRYQLERQGPPLTPMP
ncbi:MAG: tRNA 2-thiocytidine biosynthesis TtcA family protein [Humidesulfovibrio sp.]|nr:tRNA 2-thiocytidine biosynthesis TtcA family protein [Humidesulfovibrio sp.]